MRNESCTYILIIANSDMDKLKRTIDSILEQTVDKELLKVLIIDNASQDGTYSHLIDYEIEYPQLISIIREKRPTTRGRLLKRMIWHLRYAEVGSSMIMNPGDIIYPDFIKNARMILQLKENLDCLVYETDIWEGQKAKSQVPIFTANCIITKLCEDVYYRNGIGHKVQMFYRELPVGLDVKLPYYEVVVKNHDWLAVACLRCLRCLRDGVNAYIKESGGCICEEEVDIKSELIEWAFWVKRNFYAIETRVFSTKNALNVQKEDVDEAYNCLSIMALQYARQKIKKGLVTEAEDALVFAEMMNLNIGEDDRYVQLQQAISSQNCNEKLDALFEAKSEVPPRVSLQF